MKFKVYWKAKGVCGNIKQGHDVIEAKYEGEIDTLFNREINGDTKDSFASELKIAEAIMLFDAGCDYWKITKIVPLTDAPKEAGKQ